MMARAKANLQLGHAPAARTKANQSLRIIATSTEWRRRVGKATREKLYDPEIRARHLAGIKAAQERHGLNFRGGNGDHPTGAEDQAAKILVPAGFIRQLVVKTRNHGTPHRPPPSYKLDFGHPTARIGIELDGPSHRFGDRERQDQKKNEVLGALGWRVERFKHKQSDVFSLTSKDAEKLCKLLESLTATQGQNVS
jgi:hypothetical protein